MQSFQRTHRSRRISSLGMFFIVIAAIMVAADALGDSIELRRAVRLSPGTQALTLADIAVLEGPAAESLADVVIFTTDREVDSAMTISLEDLRTTLEAAGAQWATLHLKGGDITLRPPARNDGMPRAMHGATIERAAAPPIPREHSENTYLAAGIVREDTLRGAIAQRFVHALQIDPADLRLTFEVEDDALLSAALTDARFEIQPRSSMESERVDILIRRWTEGVVMDAQHITVHPLIRTRVATLHCDVMRGRTLLDGDFHTAEQWLSPVAARIHAEPATITGRIASSTLRAGNAIRARDVTSGHVVERGDRVTVRCVSGSVVVTMTAEAREAGAVGDEIQLRKLGERETFSAVVASAGEAVVDLNRQ